MINVAKMLQPIRSLCVILCVSFLFLESQALFINTFGRTPMRFISRSGVYGGEESFVSIGKSQIVVYPRRQYSSQPWYQMPIMQFVRIFPSARTPGRHPVPACQLLGTCRAKPHKHVRRPPVRHHYKPTARPLQVTKKPKTYKPPPPPKYRRV